MVARQRVGRDRRHGNRQRRRHSLGQPASVLTVIEPGPRSGTGLLCPAIGSRSSTSAHRAQRASPANSARSTAIERLGRDRHASRSTVPTDHHRRALPPSFPVNATGNPMHATPASVRWDQSGTVYKLNLATRGGSRGGDLGSNRRRDPRARSRTRRWSSRTASPSPSALSSADRVV